MNCFSKAFEHFYKINNQDKYLSFKGNNFINIKKKNGKK